MVVEIEMEMKIEMLIVNLKVAVVMKVKINKKDEVKEVKNMAKCLRWR